MPNIKATKHEIEEDYTALCFDVTLGGRLTDGRKSGMERVDTKWAICGWRWRGGR
jgi:hypothetical protein